MKKTLLAFTLLVSFAITAKAQDTLRNPADYRTHLSKVATLCDVVYQVKVISDTVTYLYMGGNVPHQKFTIAVKGNKLQLDWANLKNKHLCVTGTVVMYKNTIQVIAFEPGHIKVDQ
ncbi:hypothetical protein ACFS5N_16195 [Mucilaginibacter ximonensis]|uniref:Nucleic acid binding protein n=1 Tax=Mucilaginibacter ximonensis TaxID=538021 RepID=A0ABW5YG73_9SPHI